MDYTKRIITGYYIENGVIYTKEEDKLIINTHTMVYPEVSKLRRKLSTSEALLMDYVSENCIGNEPFTYDNFFREKFNEWLVNDGFFEDGKLGFIKGTIDKAMTTLYEYRVILRVGRGRYFVNPEYFFKGTPEWRLKRIGEINELSAKYKFLIEQKNDKDEKGED
jgi:hypothetical protein